MVLGRRESRRWWPRIWRTAVTCGWGMFCADRRLGCRIGARPLALAENAPVASAPPEIRLYTNAAMTKYLAYYLRRGYNRDPPSPAGRLPPGLLPQRLTT
jgi:hypothetical protein